MNQDKVDEKRQVDKPGWKKILWFVGLWLAGVLTLATIGLIIKAVLS